MFRPGWMEEFDKEHGVPVLVGEVLLFPDGARRANNPLGASRGPLENPYHRAQDIERYHRHRLVRATQAFNAESDAIESHLLACQKDASAPPPSPERLDKLRKLRDRVQAYQAAFDKARADVEAAKPEHIRAHEMQQVSNRQATEAFLEEFKNIKI